MTNASSASGNEQTDFTAEIETVGLFEACPPYETGVLTSGEWVLLDVNQTFKIQRWAFESVDASCTKFRIKADTPDGPKYLTMPENCTIKSPKVVGNISDTSQSLWTLSKVEKNVAIGCDDDTLALQCPQGTMIDVLRVTYGRLSSKVCPQVLDAWPGGNDDGQCSFPAGDIKWFDFITARCNSRQQCMVFVFYWISGYNTLFGVYKYAEVEYTCISPTSSRPILPACLPKHENCEVNFGNSEQPLPCCDGLTCEFGRCIACKSFGEACTENLECCGGNYLCIKGVCAASPKNQTGTIRPVLPGNLFVRACESTYLDVYCPAGQVIEIISATYGRESFKMCTHGHEAWANEPIYDNKLCGKSDYNEQWFGIMSERCNNRQGCSVFATNTVAGDPCSGTYKYAEIVYNCILPKNSTAELPFCLPGRGNCGRVFGPIGEPTPCCSGLSCELGVCIKCLAPGSTCYNDLQCCGDTNYCVTGTCQYQISPHTKVCAGLHEDDHDDYYYCK